MKTIASNLIRWAGLSAMVAGSIFVVMGMFHPPNILSPVTTTRWAIVHVLAIAMSFFGLLGITGLYARQVKEAGWLQSGRLYLVSYLAGARDGLYLRRSLLSCRCWRPRCRRFGGLLGDVHRARQRNEPRRPPSGMDANRAPVYPRRPAVWHRDATAPACCTRWAGWRVFASGPC